MDLDKLLIDHILAAGKVDHIIDAGITTDDLEGEAQKIYGAILAHFRNPRYKGAIPSAAIIQRKYPDYEYDPPTESHEWVIDEIKKRSVYNYQTEALRKISKALKGNDVEEAANLFNRASVDIAQRMVAGSTLSLTRNMSERWQSYQRRKQGMDIYGIPTGFERIDHYTLGWQPEDLIMFLAKRGVGKTWALLISALSAQRAGHCVMCVSREMSNAAFSRRYDALYAQLPYHQFRRGQLGEFAEENYERALQAMKDLPPFYLPEFPGKCTPLMIRAKARELGATAVYIDGIYMCDDDEGVVAPDWKRHFNIARGLKEIVKAEKWSLVFTNQLNKGKDAKDADLDNSAYSDAYGQFADVAIKFRRTLDDRANKQMGMEFLKVREDDAPQHVIHMDWDFDQMKFGGAADPGEYEPEQTKEVSY